MEFLVGLFIGSTIPSLWFSLFVGAFVVAYFICEAKESEGFAMFLAICVAFTLYFITNPSGEFYKAAFSHGWITLACVIGYFIFGALYSIVKWWRFYVYKTERFKEDCSTESNMYSDYLKSFLERTRASNYKAMLFMWILYWPLSLVWLVINDPITKLVNAMVARLGGTYDRISAYVSKDLRNELAAIEAKKK